MPTLDLVRIVCTDVGTHGLLSIPGHLSPFHVCEDPVREPATGPGDVAAWKVKGQTAIPYGTYKLAWTRSTRLSKKHGRDYFTLQLLDVPGFGGIRIHGGNMPKDTEGCLLPGLRAAKDGIGVLESRKAVRQIEGLVCPPLDAGESVSITIRRPL